MHKLFRKGQKEAALKIRKHLQKRPSLDPHDPDYRRLKYIRDAADFALAFTGPKAEAEEIKRLIATFLREELGLHLSEEKPLLTHARTSAARFLGYEITTLHSNAKHSKTKAGFKRRSINGRIGLRIPRALLTERALVTSEETQPSTGRNCSMKVTTRSWQPTSSNTEGGIANYYHCA